MAARFFINGGINSNWSSTTNWSTTSGGSGGSSVPTNADDVTFDTNSPNCTIDTTSNCKTFTATNYSHTITFNSTLTTIGNVTLGANMVFGGTYSLIVASSSTFTSNNKHLGVPISFYNNLTGSSDLNITLADTLYSNFEFNVMQSYPTSSQNINISGATAVISSNLTDRTIEVGGQATPILTGNSTLLFNGNTTIYIASGNFDFYNPLYVSCSTLTYDPNLYTIQFRSNYTYTAGTITYNNLSNIYLDGNNIINSTATIPVTVNLQGSILVTFSSTFSCGTLSCGGAANTYAGFGFITDYLIITDPSAIHLAPGVEYKVNKFLQVAGYYTDTIVSSTSGNTIDSSSPGSKAYLTVASTASTDITYLTVTDIDSSRGQKLYIYNGILSNTTNWDFVSITKSTVSKTFVN